MLEPGAAAVERIGAVAAERVMDGAGDDASARGGRRHHAEQRQAGDEILGAVDRVDDERKFRRGDRIEQPGVVVHRFLAHHHRTRKRRQQRARDVRLGRFVGAGDDIEGRGLLPDLVGYQAAEKRHDLHARSIRENGADATKIG